MSDWKPPKSAPIGVNLDTGKELNFHPVEVTIHSKRECSILLYRMWEVGCEKLTPEQVMNMLYMWSIQQDKKEELVKWILTEVINHLCPHYEISYTVNEEYERELKEHNQLLNLAKMVQRDVEGLEQWGRQ